MRADTAAACLEMLGDGGSRRFTSCMTHGTINTEKQYVKQKKAMLVAASAVRYAASAHADDGRSIYKPSGFGALSAPSSWLPAG